MNDAFALILRPFAETDFDAVCRWFADERSLVQWGGPETRFPLDKEQLHSMLEEGGGSYPKRWLFSGDTSGILVGHAQVALDWSHGVARLSRIAISPASRGRGCGEALLRAVLEKILHHVEFERIELNVYTFNAAAIALYRKLGFVEEGIRRSAVRVGAERWDTAMYGLLRGRR